MGFEHILYEVSDAVCTVTLNRPDKLNALSGTMLAELLQALELADADDAVRVLVVTGAGRAFCAGADLSAGARTFDNAARGRTTAPEEHRDGGGIFTLRAFDMKKPMIAAINGPAVGFGITMTLPMDIRLASTRARMGFVFARRGVVPEACSTWFLPRLVGISQAAEWVYTGRVFDADEAHRAGLVSRVVEPEDLLPAARPARARDRRPHLRGVGGPRAPDALEDAGRRPSHGGPPRRLAGDVLDRAVRRRARGRDRLPREATRALHLAPERGHAPLLPVVGAPARRQLPPDP